MLFTWVRQLRGVVVRSPSSCMPRPPPLPPTISVPERLARATTLTSCNQKSGRCSREIGTGTGRREQPAAKGAFWSRQVQQEPLVLPAPTHCKGTPPVISTAPQPPAVSHALEQGGAGGLPGLLAPALRGAPCCVPCRCLCVGPRRPYIRHHAPGQVRAGAGGGGLPGRLE
jgi:hypothetical protein